MSFQVHEGIDHLLFNLLILGGLCDSHGRVWRCKPQDLYVIEMTDFTLQQKSKRVSLCSCIKLMCISTIRLLGIQVKFGHKTMLWKKSLEMGTYFSQK